MMKEEPMDYTISRQAAIDALGEAPEVWTDSPEELAELNQWEMDVAAIKAVPPANPENIYCKDCMFTDGIEPIADGRYWCLLHSCYMYFCSDAKRLI